MTENENRPLEACPFCGKEAKPYRCTGNGLYYTSFNDDIKTIYGREVTHLFAMCTNCGVRTKPYLTYKGMSKAWNRRVR